MQNNTSEPQRVHPLQRLMDNPWWLLFLGVMIPTISYTLWGLLDYWMMGKLP